MKPDKELNHHTPKKTSDEKHISFPIEKKENNNDTDGNQNPGNNLIDDPNIDTSDVDNGFFSDDENEEKSIKDDGKD